MTGARLLYRRVSNHLQFGGATFLTMAWRRVGNLLEFLTTVTLQCQRIGNLLDNDGVQRVGELFDSTSFVGW
jgi:hypothetical protein